MSVATAEARLSILRDDAPEPLPLAERETTIRRAEDEDTWTLWSDDPGVVGAMLRLAGRPGVTVREDGEAVWATFPAKALKIRGLRRPEKPCGVTPPQNALSTLARETIFQRSRRADAWEVATTSPRAQDALLAYVDGKAVTVRRSERRREELIFTLPARAVRIVPTTAVRIEAARRVAAARGWDELARMAAKGRAARRG